MTSIETFSSRRLGLFIHRGLRRPRLAGTASTASETAAGRVRQADVTAPSDGVRLPLRGRMEAVVDEAEAADSLLAANRQRLPQFNR